MIYLEKKTKSIIVIPTTVGTLSKSHLCNSRFNLASPA